jgi:hypothetical protein
MLAEKAAWDYVKELPGKTGSMGLCKRTSR